MVPVPLSPEKRIKTKIDARVGAYRVFALALALCYGCFPGRRGYYHECIIEEMKEKGNEA